MNEEIQTSTETPAFLTQTTPSLVEKKAKFAEFEERVAELEIKMAKLWDAMTDKPKKQDKKVKLSDFGKKTRERFLRREF